jgi:AcrR family transcriptional regulator
MDSVRRPPYDLDRLTDVALRVFVERGFDGSSMDDVARAAGITKAAIYHHARGKEALLARGLQRALHALFAIFDEPEALEGAAIERLRFIVRRVVEASIAVLPESTVLVRVRGNTQAERDALERRRAFDASLDAALAVRLIFGMCGSLVEWYRPGGSLTSEHIADATVRFVFDGVCARR